MHRLLLTCLALVLVACGEAEPPPAPRPASPAPAPEPPAARAAPICPPEGDGVRVLADRVTLEAPIAFDLYAGTVSDASWPGVDLVAQRLSACASAIDVIEIQVHTDAVRMGSFNARQSQVIADLLRQRLITDGVQAERVVACGYGESQPIAPNTTLEGRAQNMRVEWRRVNRGYACPTIAE